MRVTAEKEKAKELISWREIIHNNDTK